jgi:CoA-transferase family III
MAAAEVRPVRGAALRDDGASRAWARSGAMALTGRADGPPCAAPAAVAERVQRLAEGIRAHAGRDPFEGVDPVTLLGERAAVLGLRRRGRVSPGGSCRLLRTRDAWIAPNLARGDDLALVPAWLECAPDPAEGPWDFVARAVRERDAGTLVARARLMGLAVAAAEAWRPGEGIVRRRLGVPRARGRRRPLVIDLSSLWAGPLCTHLLERAGARVVKVESIRRPDGARRGSAAFFDLMNGGKASLALDFERAADRDVLRRLVAAADLVVESSRPRALRQLGLWDEEILAESPGLTWLSITGYGAQGREADWIAFGDDAAVAAGLALACADADGPLLCADAVADPLAGLEAAGEALRALAEGGGLRIDVSLVGAARRAFDGAVRLAADAPVAPPRARPVRRRARPLGADGAAVLRELGPR